MVFQNYALFPHLTRRAQRRLRPRDAQGTCRERSRAHRGMPSISRGCTGSRSRYPRELSGGQQQRVALARALVIEPSVLLLDEPLSNLDAALREEMRFEIREIQRRVGITTVFVTHDQTEAMAISGRLAVMKQGRIVQVGTPEAIYRAPVDAFVAGFIGQANLVPATSHRADRRWRADADGGRHAAPDCRRAAADSRRADRVSIVVRPEDLWVAASPTPAKNNVCARLAEATYLGSATRLVAQVGATTITVSSNRPSVALKVGEEIHLEWDPAHCSLIADETPGGTPH